MNVETLTWGQACDRLRDIHDELEGMSGKHRLSRSDEARFAALQDEWETVNQHRLGLERCQVIADVARGGGGPLRVERGSGDNYDADPLADPASAQDPRRFRNPWELSEVRTFGEPGQVAGELRARARSAIEAMPGASDNIRSAATGILERFDTKDSRIARHVLATSSPAYLRAWSKMATSKQDSLTVEERRALAAVDQYRAMSLTDSAGGFLVPFQLDPTVIITSAGSRNDIRKAARQVVATGDVWHGVSAAAVQWSWDAEGSEVSDDSPPFAQPKIPVYKADGFVPITIEALADEQNVAQEVGRLLAMGRETLEAVALISGTGVGQPTGIVTALSEAPAASVVNSKTADTFAIADMYALHGALPARYRTNAQWLANNLTYNLIRQFDVYGGAALWTQLGSGTPPTLMGYPNMEAEAMNGGITPGGENFNLIFGDFENYVIADRLGMTVEFIPHLFGTAANRPTGQRGWYAYYRVGADSVNDAAFRMLNIT